MLPEQDVGLDLSTGVVPGVPDIAHIDWSTCVAVSRAREGSQQVVFVQVGTGVVVLKASRDVGQEYMSSELAKLLQVKVPECRLVMESSVEYALMMSAMMAVASPDDLSYDT